MFALLLAHVLSEDNDEIKLLNIGKAGEIAIPAGTLVFLACLSIVLYFIFGKHLDDDIPLEKIMVLDDMSGSDSIDEQDTSKPDEESASTQPVVIDEL
ncbi:hypothetical protein TVAG_470060 [Trichomonas vaginalis G3]|uniref:Uncharacterized protein n=1 Tax=Trichomonas vaginalis (strain ATCC PRA-98 / G3) TaxID=412133 RepID=A2FE13_TRIV3|nr:hypothetical protein TVAGG3_0553560 [Trichomonas vaginalis G3]EAX96841.1 hypothetical protein TVAG_470060 [Trichomonas vaginalis G3]KAI5520694.1 hypothetical protein TVAGG3_0553560 [Trichomonas vaginalis G3]|eukprot:XP_001309771.1 hypothetical protein [Trichomonas vaginalis G3]